jgi:hypothetical protein
LYLIFFGLLSNISLESKVQISLCLLSKSAAAINPKNPKPSQQDVATVYGGATGPVGFVHHQKFRRRFFPCRRLLCCSVSFALFQKRPLLFSVVLLFQSFGAVVLGLLAVLISPAYLRRSFRGQPHLFFWFCFWCLAWLVVGLV